MSRPAVTDATTVPLLNRGPEALQKLLEGRPALAREQLRLLTRTELGLLEVTARLLTEFIRNTYEETWPSRTALVAPEGCDDCSVEPGETHRWAGCPGNERAARRAAEGSLRGEADA